MRSLTYQKEDTVKLVNKNIIRDDAPQILQGYQNQRIITVGFLLIACFLPRRELITGKKVDTSDTFNPLF